MQRRCPLHAKTVAPACEGDCSHLQVRHSDFAFLNIFWCHSGWKAILLTWAWALVIWQVADFVKFLTTLVLQRAEDIQTDCKHSQKPLPLWVKVVNAPGVAGGWFMTVACKPFVVSMLYTQQHGLDYLTATRTCALLAHHSVPNPQHGCGWMWEAFHSGRH